MTLKSFLTKFLLGLWLVSGIAAAEPSLDSEFDARPLLTQEKRTLQAALSFSGDYVGLLDGAWGKGSQRALELYSLRTIGSDKPRFQDVLPVLQAFEEERLLSGWEIFYSEDTNTSYAYLSRPA